jgi:hypothetical protein
VTELVTVETFMNVNHAYMARLRLDIVPPENPIRAPIPR